MKVKLSTIVLLIMLLPAIMLAQTVHQVEAGVDSIDNALFSAVAGDTIELTTDGGIYQESFSAIIDVPLTIRAAAGLTNKPVWVCDDTVSMIRVWDDFTLAGIKLDGSLGAGQTEYGVKTDSGDTKLDYNLTIDNCDFVNFNMDTNWVDYDGRAIYANTYTQANVVTIKNSYFENIGDRCIYFKDGRTAPGSVKSITIENCTIWKVGEEAIYIEDDDNDVSTPGPEVLINHVTLWDAGLGDPDIKVIYTKGMDGAVIKNSIVGASEKIAGVSARIYGENSQVLWFMDYNTDDVSLKDGASMDDTTGTNYLENVNPGFKDPANGDFALADTSAAIGFGEIGANLGDPRWGTFVVDAIDDRDMIVPEKLTLHQNYPNPFNPSTTIAFDLAKAGKVRLEIYNVLGQQVDVLAEGQMPVGEHKVVWNAQAFTTGVYFYKLSINNTVKVRKMILMK